MIKFLLVVIVLWCLAHWWVLAIISAVKNKVKVQQMERLLDWEHQRNERLDDRL